jgi:hypothetical protein
MKLEKLILFNNEQDEDALKHIYTLLISNPTLLVEIDLPKYEDRISKIESDSSDDDEDSARPRDLNQVSVMPYSPRGNNDPGGMPHDHESELELTNELNLETEDEEATKKREEQEAKERKMRMIKKYCFKSYVNLFHRDKSKPKLSCAQIFCGNFLRARLHLLRFKISWDYLVKVERNTAPKIFVILAM